MKLGKLEVDLGRKIHIVGKAGTGKTTLAKILIGEIIKDKYPIHIFSDDYSDYKDLENTKIISEILHQQNRSDENIYDIIRTNSNCTFFVIDKPIFKLKVINQLSANNWNYLIFISPQISYGSRSITPDSTNFDTVIVTNGVKLLDSKLVQKIKNKFGIKLKYSLSLNIIKCRYCDYEENIILKFRK